MAAGRRDLPGGLIHATDHWRVEHCVGPLGLGTLIVKPARHVVHVADLNSAESAELGPLLQATSRVVTELRQPDQVYVCLWSHAGMRPVHIHFVVQPVPRPRAKLLTGPSRQALMFRFGRPPRPAAVEAIAAAARQRFSS